MIFGVEKGLFTSVFFNKLEILTDFDVKFFIKSVNLNRRFNDLKEKISSLEENGLNLRLHAPNYHFEISVTLIFQV